MIIDKNMQFLAAQAVAATAVSENVVHIGADARNSTQNLGVGEPVWLVVKLATDKAAGAGSLTITLETADKADMSAATTLCASAKMVASTWQPFATLYAVALPSADYKRYLAVRYTVDGAVAGAKLDAFITKDVQANTAYASGFEVA